MAKVKTAKVKNPLIGKAARKLLLTKQPYTVILKKLRAEFPESSTTIGALRWYASKMRQEKIKLPERERAEKGNG